MNAERMSDRFGATTRRLSRLRGKAYRRLLPDTFAPACLVGAGLTLENPKQLRLGRAVILHHRVQLLCVGEGRIDVGAKTFMNTGSIVASSEAITIGEDVLFGPNVCVVDADHEFRDPDVAIARQGMRQRGPIVIGDGAWVATGAVILGGTEIAPRSVVAANAVVRGIFPKRCVIAGTPAKVVRYLDEDEG